MLSSMGIMMVRPNSISFEVNNMNAKAPQNLGESRVNDEVYLFRLGELEDIGVLQSLLDGYPVIGVEAKTFPEEVESICV